MDEKELIGKILSVPFESRSVEFKRLGTRNEGVDKTLQSIVAMANTDGGVLIIGVDDPQKTKLKGIERIYGLEENPELFDEIGRSLTKISPPISQIWPPQIIKVPESNKTLALVAIPKSISVLHSIENHVYVRLERGNKRLSPQEIIHFAYVKGFERADRELVDVDFKLLKTSFFESWRRARSIEDNQVEIILEKTGLARKNEKGELRPTRAAVLLFSEFPNDLIETKCSIRVFQYEGNQEIIGEKPNLLGTPKNIGGPVIKQISDAHEYVLTLLQSGIRIPSGFVTTYRIPERAVKEAITNAVVHRDYHTQRDIEIRIFEDRVEVESPGLLPSNITPSNIGYARAFNYRNDLLVKHLREFPDPPNLDQNEGVRAMRKTMTQANLYPPLFWTYPNLQDSVRVILLNQKAPSEWEKISQFLQESKFISNKEARKILGISDTVKMSKLFKRWVKQGLLMSSTSNSGAKRNMRYRLPASDESTLFTKAEGK
ncbi:MAG: putative DNA binding domain-containing protein [Elusimicrobia bacterium]|nr:putative DNA binding domain-containing protein [Candidatus Obscuribacterium magneticum]